MIPPTSRSATAKNDAARRCLLERSRAVSAWRGSGAARLGMSSKPTATVLPTAFVAGAAAAPIAPPRCGRFRQSESTWVRIVSAMTTSVGSRVSSGSGLTRPAALVPETLRSAAVRLAEGLAQRNLDARGEVVVVLLLREIGDLASDIRARVRALLPCDLAKEVETALRAERRPKRRLAREDDVGRIRTELGGRAQLRDEARLAHRERV